MLARPGRWHISQAHAICCCCCCKTLSLGVCCCSWREVMLVLANESRRTQRLRVHGVADNRSSRSSIESQNPGNRVYDRMRWSNFKLVRSELTARLTLARLPARSASLALSTYAEAASRFCRSCSKHRLPD